MDLSHIRMQIYVDYQSTVHVLFSNSPLSESDTDFYTYRWTTIIAIRQKFLTIRTIRCWPLSTAWLRLWHNSYFTQSSYCPVSDSTVAINYIKTNTSARIPTTTPEAKSILSPIVTNNDKGKIYGKGSGGKCLFTSLNYCAGVSETAKPPSHNRQRVGWDSTNASPKQKSEALRLTQSHSTSNIILRRSYRKSWATLFCMRTGNSRRRRVRW